MIDKRSKARAVVTAGLTLALSIGQAALPVTMAFATTYGSGEVTITQLHNTDATYEGYQLFKANITPGENGNPDTAQHIDWSDDKMKTSVLTFLNTWDGDNNGVKDYAAWLEANHPGTGQDEKAQNAAEFIAEQIGLSPTAMGTATTPRTTQGLSFANELAQHLSADSTLVGQFHSTLTAGSKFTGPEGFWFICTTDSTTAADDEAGTAPIWLPLGGATTTINEKSAIPTIDKQVKEDSSGAYGKTADANTGQDLDYKLIGTLPENYDAFDFYHYKFEDTLQSGLTMKDNDTSSVVVKVGDQVVPAGAYTATWADNKLTVDIADLKVAPYSGYNITKDTVITVEYKTHMNDTRNIGATGNQNEVFLTYTDDPISNQDGKTSKKDVKVFAYELELKKVDEQTNQNLAGAKFTIQVAQSNTDADSKGKYVQADGSLGATAYEFTTNANGIFGVKGLDEGVYTIRETTAPTGYDLMDEDITLTVASTLNNTNKSLDNLTATLTGGDAVDVNNASITEVSAVDGSAGKIAINATNDKITPLPITGAEGIKLLTIAGVGVVAVSVAAMLRQSRRRNEGDLA